MNDELKKQILGLTVRELAELIVQPQIVLNEKPISSASDVSNLRYSIGRLDVRINEVRKDVEWGKEKKTVSVVTEYEIIMPEGKLCYVTEKSEIQKMLKEINMVIAKYQK
jgi:hypothetical protein